MPGPPSSCKFLDVIWILNLIIMASVDTTLYSASIVIVIASIYFLKYFHAESFLSKTLSKFPTWLGGNVGKAGLQRFDPLASPLEECITPQYNSSWWTDEKQFQLERRAIFSKVRGSTSTTQTELVSFKLFVRLIGWVSWTP